MTKYLKTLIEECVDEKIWEKKLEKYDSVPFFFSWKWKSLLEKTYPWMKPSYFICDDALLAGFTYKNAFLSIPVCEYGGILSKDKKTEKILSNEILKLNKNKKIIIKDNSTTKEEILKYKSEELVTYINKLTIPENELFDNLRKTTRHSIRYAQQDKIKVKKIDNVSDLKKFYGAYLSTIKRNKGIAQPYKLFKEIFSLQKTNDVVLLGSYKDNKFLSGLVVFFHKDYASYYISANTKESYKYHSNYLLIWEAIKIAKKKKMKTFDFGAAMINSPGETFKKGWGGQRIVLTKYSDTKSETPDKNGFARFILGKIPTQGMKLINQQLTKKAFEYM